MRDAENYAVSEVLGLLFVMILVVSASIFVLATRGNDLITENAHAREKSALKQLTMMSTVFQDLLRQGKHSSKNVDFVADKGSVSIGEEGTRYVLFYSLDSGFDFSVSGFNTTESSYNAKQFNLTFLTGSANKLDIFYLYNESLSDDDFNIPPTHIIANNELIKAVQIDIRHDENVVGRIWVFDVGSFSYESSTSSGTFQISVENGGVITGGPDSYYLDKEPKMYTITQGSTQSLVLRVMQFRSDPLTLGGSGKISCRFQMKYLENQIREQKIPLAKQTLNIQVFGDRQGVWLRYFQSHFPTASYSAPTMSIPLNSFTLIHSVFDLDLEVTG